MIKKIFIYLCLIFILSCGDDTPYQSAVENVMNSAVKGETQLLVPSSVSNLETLIPELKKYQDDVKMSLASPKPIQLMRPSAYDSQAKVLAQNLALNHPDFTRDFRHRETKKAIHSEISSIRQLTDQEVMGFKINFPPQDCYRVESYNYFYNMTVVAIVNVKTRQVLGINHLPAAAPEQNKRIESLALKVAIQYPEIAKELNTSPGILPTDYKINVQNSKCERSRHYCLAVVFQKDNTKLWTIVDVNDWHLIGWQWVIDEKQNRPVIVTERTIQNDFVMEQYCNKDNQLKKNDWDITYTLTSSDGLEIKNVNFKGKKVINSAKLVDWHVSYTFNDGFGYSDAIGCPMFSSAAVVAFAEPEVEPLVNGGFALIQDFRSPVWPLACNYRYQNRYEFYPDGSFRITGVNLGIGCGADGEYRPVFRIDLAMPNAVFQQWENDNWNKWDVENWNLQDAQSTYTSQGYLYKLTSQNAGYYIEPGNGQFEDDGRGDNAFTYITVKQKGEGEEDMPTFGECCNKDYKQGPEMFMQPAQSLEGKDLIIWYVPQMYNDKKIGEEYCWADVHVDSLGKAAFKTWQGVIGPKFIPFNSTNND